jgi:hypothetical protein
MSRTDVTTRSVKPSGRKKLSAVLTSLSSSLIHAFRKPLTL